jgi:hypothetical protein
MPENNLDSRGKRDDNEHKKAGQKWLVRIKLFSSADREPVEIVEIDKFHVQLRRDTGRENWFFKENVEFIEELK